MFFLFQAPDTCSGLSIVVLCLLKLNRLLILHVSWFSLRECYFVVLFDYVPFSTHFNRAAALTWHVCMHCTWNIDISKIDWLNYPAREENSSQEVYIVSIHVFIKPKQTLTNKGVLEVCEHSFYTRKRSYTFSNTQTLAQTILTYFN